MATISLRARQLKAALRSALDDSGVSGRKAAERLEVPPMRVSRWLSMEENAPALDDVKDLLRAIGVQGAEYDRIVRLATTTGLDWVVSGSSSINPQLASVLEAERDAHEIVECAPLVLPGLLQIRSYAEAVAASEDLSTLELETRVMMRLARADAITRRRAPVQFHAFIGLAAITAGIGGPNVMADQLAHLLEMGQRPNVTIQAVDLQTGRMTPAHSGSFILYLFDQIPDTVYFEHLSSGAFTLEPGDLATVKAAAETLRRVAMSPEATAELIASVIPADVETTTK